MTTALRLTEEVLAAVRAAAVPLPPDRRARFLEVAGQRLAALPETGLSAARQALANLQREFLMGWFEPPTSSQ
jgi:hypothetical protein